MRRSVGKFTLGVVLVAFGVVLGFDVYGGNPVPRDMLLRLWPLAIVLLGIEYLVASRDPEAHVRVSGGAVFLTILLIVSAFVYDAGIFLGNLFDFGEFGNYGIFAAESYTYQVDVNEAIGTGVTELEIRAIGDVIITGADTASVTGTAECTVRARTAEEAKRYAQEIKLVPRYSGKTLYLEFVRPDSVPGRVSIGGSFVLQVPAGSDLDIRTVSGGIEVEGVTGRLDLDSVSGGIEVDGSPARIDANNVSGSFRCSLGKNMEELKVETVSGSITIEVPEGTGGSVSVRTVSGSIDSNVGGLNITGSPGKREAKGTIGSGSTDIDLHSVSGSVSFR